MNGTVESITTDWRGDTLDAAVLSTATVLPVGDTTDFDEDGGWLTIADATPVAYLSVDHDAATVTLAAAVGAAFEAGDPVFVWDPSVLPAGAKVVEYVASVMTDRGSMEATIPHAVVPLAGVDRLIGASVALAEEDGGEWYVAQVYGRESSVDQVYLDVPFITLYQATDNTFPDNTTQPLANWTVATEESEAFSQPGSGRVKFNEAGLFLVTLVVVWAGNSTGRRYVDLKTELAGVSSILQSNYGAPPDAANFFQQIVTVYRATVGEELWVEVRQTSGATLAVKGSASGRNTKLQIVRVQA